MEFIGFPKMPRISRDCVITEKIDGTNAQVTIIDVTLSKERTDGVEDCREPGPIASLHGTGIVMFAGSRTKWIQPGKNDNYGFAGWCQANAEELFRLGPGSHFGEWWGSGIQRRYGLSGGDKRFSLFNVARWGDDAVRPACCHVVPILYRGPFDTDVVDGVLGDLERHGSRAAPGFMQPEGIVIWHEAARMTFKKTLGDDGHKGN